MENKGRITKRIGKSVDFSDDVIKKKLSHKNGVRLLFNTLAYYEDLQEKQNMGNQEIIDEKRSETEQSIEQSKSKYKLNKKYHEFEDFLLSEENNEMSNETKAAMAWANLTILVNSDIISEKQKDILFGKFSSKLMRFEK